MTSRNFLIFCMLLLWIPAAAQNFEPGYYVTLQGDTVRSKLYIHKRFGTPIQIQLENNALFGASSIKGFGIGEAAYVSKIVFVDKSPKKDIVADTTFLEVIVRGEMNLLYYRDEAPKTHFILEKEDGSLEELGLKIFDLGDHKQFRQLTTYKDVLKKNFPTCADLFKAIDKISYDRNHIQDIFLKLYNCKYGSKAPKANVKEKPYVEMGIVAGFVQNSITFKNDSRSALTYMKFSNSSNATGGIFVDIVFPGIPLAFLRTEMLFSSYNTSAPEVSTTPTSSTEYRSSAGFKSSYLRGNFLLRRNLSKKSTSPFVNLGASVSALISHSGYYHEKRYTGGAMYFDETFDFFTESHTSVELGFMAGIGWNIKRLGIEARYELSDGIKPVDFVPAGLVFDKIAPSSPVNSLYILVSYKILEHKRQ